MKGKEWGRARARREADKEEPTDSERGFSNIIRPQLPTMVSSLSLGRSFARSCSTAHTHTHAPCSSASRIFKQVISPPSPLPTSPHPSITRPERTENGDLRSLPFDACQACLCLPPSQQTELQFVSNMCLRTKNGAQVLQVQNWFQESHAGRQCKGSRHRSSDFLQLKLNAHCAKMWKMKQLMDSRMRFAEGISNNAHRHVVLGRSSP